MLLLYFKFVFLIGAITSFLVGLVVLLRNKKNNVNRSFAFLSFCSSFWNLGFFLLLNSTTYNAAYSWRLVMDYGAILIPAFWLHFVFSILGQNKKRSKEIFFYYLLAFGISIFNTLELFYPGIFIKTVEPKLVFSYYPTAGFGYYLFILFYIFSIPYSLFLLLQKSRKSIRLNLQQIKLIILAGSLGFVGGSTAFLPTFGILILPLGVIFVALYPTIIGYAIIRYRLMDIRLVILRTVTFAFLLFVITSLFAVISSIIGEFFVEQVGFKSNLVVGLIVGLLVTTAYNPVRKLLERATNQYLYKQSYDPDELLTEISNTASSILDLQKLLTAISDLLDTAMQPSRIGIALVNKRGLLQIYFERGFKEGEAKTLARGNEEVMWKHFKREPGVAVIDELITRYEAGDYQPISKLVLYALKEHDIGAVVPLYVQDKLIGIMALGNKKSGDVYNQQDIGLLGIINGQVAVAVDNARLYEELKVFNITLQQKVDEATADLRGANRQLKLMDQTKSEFISIASHQLRTPLTISKGYISMMLEGSFGKVPGKIRETLDKVYQANERLITLVENLLDISRIESGRQEFTWDTFDFVELAKSVTDEHELPAKRKKVKLLFHGPKKELMVYGDKNKLHEMMFNFIDNSIKYTDKGKTEVFVTEEGDNLRFAVKDTGRGVTEDTIAHLFKKFSRGKDSFKVHTEGTGLGLYVVRMIAEAHHGNVGVESAGRDTGSTFFFIIPKNGPKAEGYKPQEPIRKYTGVHTEESDEKEEEETQSETEPQETEE